MAALAFFGLTTSQPPDPPSGPCRVGYTVSPWNIGLTATITIANTGTAPTNGWSLRFTLPSGQTITSEWNAGYTPTSGEVTATSVAHDAAIDPGASVGIGFQATQRATRRRRPRSPSTEASASSTLFALLFRRLWLRALPAAGAVPAVAGVGDAQVVAAHVLR